MGSEMCIRDREWIEPHLSDPVALALFGVAIYSSTMPILDDLADYLTEETAMTVHEAVLLMSGEGDELPKVRLFTDGVTVHGFFRAPAGLFMCEMTNVGKDPFFSELEQGNIEVGEAIRLDPNEAFVIEGNWPAKKVEIDGQYYALPRNFAQKFQDLIKESRVKKRRRR